MHPRRLVTSEFEGVADQVLEEPTELHVIGHHDRELIVGNDRSALPDRHL